MIQLLGIELDPAVVPVVLNAVIISVWITLVSFPVLVGVVLVSISVVRTVVQGVGDSVLVLVVIGVAGVSEGVLIPVSLVSVTVVGAVVANIAESVSIRVLLVPVLHQRTVVFLIENSVVVLVRVAGIAQPVLVCVLLVQVLYEGTIITGVSSHVLAGGVGVHLVRVGDERTVVRGVGDAVIVSVVIAGVSDPVSVTVLLAGVGGVDTVVHPALRILAGDIVVRPAVQIPVRPAELAVPGPANLTLTDVVRLPQRFDAVGVLVADRSVRADPGPVGAADVLVADKAGHAGPAVEGAVSVDTDRVLHAAPVVLLALVDVVADLLLSGREVQPDPREAVAAGESGRTGTTAEAWDEVVAGGGDIAGIRQVALVQVVAPGPVTSQAVRTDAALVVGGVVYVVALHVSEAGGRGLLADVRHAGHTVSSEALRTGPTLVVRRVKGGVAGDALEAGFVPACVSLAVAAVTFVAGGTGPALRALCRVPAVNTGRTLEARIGQVSAERLLDLARLALHQSLPQQHRLLLLGLHLVLQPPQGLDELLQGGDQEPVGLVEVEERNVSSPVGVEVGVRGGGGLLGLHLLHGALQLLQHVLPGLLAVDLDTDREGVVHLHLGVQHLLLEVSEGDGQAQLSFTDTGEVDCQLALVVSVLVEHQHQVVVCPALGQELDLGAQLDVFTPNILKNEMSCLV